MVTLSPHIISGSHYALMLVALAALAGTVSAAPIYNVEDSAFIRRNGVHYNNRPLYCKNLNAMVLAGDRPFLRLIHDPHHQYGTLMVAVVRGDTGKWLDQFTEVTAQYRTARMTWTARDAAFPGLTVTFEAVTMESGPGLTARVRVAGARAGDRLVWAWGGATQRQSPGSPNISWDLDCSLNPAVLSRGFVPDDCQGNTVRLEDGLFILQPTVYKTDAGLTPHTVAGRCSVAGELKAADGQAWSSPSALLGSAPTERPLVCGALDLGAHSEAHWAVEGFVGEAVGDTARLAAPAQAFAAGWARAEALEARVVANTPDAWLNAGVAAATAAIEGAYYPPVYVHGGMAWNIPFPGWRTVFGATALGWHDNVKAEAKHYLATQIKESENRLPRAEPAVGYGQQAPDSMYNGRGRIQGQSLYNFQPQLFDQLVHDWRATADPEMEAVLRPALELHLEWEKACFDPDDDGVYESYINTWPTDSVWYAGGGTAEETAYAVYARQAALEMAQRAGDTAAAQKHQTELEKIRAGFMKSLWIPAKGHVGAWREQTGHQRLHDDAWLYSIFLPIDAGLLDPAQAAQALHYTEWGLERVKMPLGGERCWTSNWVPSQWSVREMFPGDNYHLALAYFQTGLAEEGWSLLAGTSREQMLNGPCPGNLGTPNGGVDFNDCSSMFCRAVVEGLFGYAPDYPNGVVRIAPHFPAAWDHASLKTPDFSLSFWRTDAATSLSVTLARPAALEVCLPLRAKQVTGVRVNGQAAQWTLRPGFGQSILQVTIPAGPAATIEVASAEPLPLAPAVAVAGKVGEMVTLRAEDGAITRLEDPQGVLQDATLRDGAVVAQVAQNAGHHLVLGLTQTGQTEQWRLFKLAVSDPAAEAARAAKVNNPIPPDGQWQCLDLAGVLNGDVRTIIQQKYLSPRPPTCSLRIGDDGYSAWTFYYWGLKPPTIDLANVAAMTQFYMPAYEAGPDDALELTDAVTLEAWVKAQPMGEYGGRILDKGRPGTLDGYLLDTSPGNSLRLLTANGMCQFAAKLSADQWTHVVGVYSASQKIQKLYLDGREVASLTQGAFPPLIKTSGPLFVGTDPTGANRFQGQIQRAAVYGRALTAAEIAQRAVTAPDGHAPLGGVVAEWALDDQPSTTVQPVAGVLTLRHQGAVETAGGRLTTPQGVPFNWTGGEKNIAFTSQWDNWPRRVSLPVNQTAEAAWFLVAGSTNPMQTRIANAELRLKYADGVVETLELVPPDNYWSLCPYGNADYNYERDRFCLPAVPPATVQLGANCRAMLLSWRLRPGVALASVTLETLSPEVVVGLMGVTLLGSSTDSAAKPTEEPES